MAVWAVPLAYLVRFLLLFKVLRNRLELHVADLLAVIPRCICVVCSSLVRSGFSTWLATGNHNWHGGHAHFGGLLCHRAVDCFQIHMVFGRTAGGHG